MSKLAIDGGTPVFQSPYATLRNASGRSIGQAEIDQVVEVLQSGCLAYIYGTKVRQFEADFAAMFGNEIAVATSSGTASLHTALIYLNPEPGDEIIVSPLTDMGSVIPILSQLAIPVFVDIDPFDQNMDPKLIEAAITPRTKAIIVTHLYGAPADMDAIMAVARRHNLFVIEDCAQAHMAKYKGHTVGTIGDMACFSLQQSKHITVGDGGVVTTNRDKEFGRGIRLCMDKGWPRDVGGRDHLFLAPNYHMTELQAAVGIAQLTKLGKAIDIRRQMAAKLDLELNQVPGLRLLGVHDGCVEVRWAYCFCLNLQALTVDGAQVVQALKAEGVDCFLGYPGPKPIYKYPVVQDATTFGTSGWPFTLVAPEKRVNYAEAICPLAEAACLETVVLWWHEGITEADVRGLGAAVRKVVNHYTA